MGVSLKLVTDQLGIHGIGIDHEYFNPNCRIAAIREEHLVTLNWLPHREP